jgi:putative transposase
MPLALKRFHHSRQLHFITFTCYHRAPLLATAAARGLVEQTLERVRRWYGFCVYAYVIMPEHLHLLISEPERGDISVAVQMLKQIVARSLGGAFGSAATMTSIYGVDPSCRRSLATYMATRSAAA